MDNKLIQTLIKQHNQLKGDLGLIFPLFESDKTFNAKTIVGYLKKFQIDLVKHLKLENGTFYVQLLKEMEEKGMKTEDTEEFIGEMKGIEKVVVAFLQQYSDVKEIKDNKDKFEKELTSIKDQLLIRVESEEEGVYMYGGSLI